MTDFFDYSKGYWIDTVIAYIFIAAIGFFLKRKFPQMAKWKVIAISFSLPLAICIGFAGYLYFTSPLSDSRGYPEARVEWRTEIKESDEPATWPFIERRYMLGCLGANGDYSVYLVKIEDITFTPGRASDFQPQYYGLKGSWNGWKKGESQLLQGQPTQVFKKYVDQSLSLCKEAESRKDSNVKQPPMEKK